MTPRRRSHNDRVWRKVRGRRLSGVLFEIDRERMRIRIRRGRVVEIIDLVLILGGTNGLETEQPATGE